jgi:hypothetical protein
VSVARQASSAWRISGCLLGRTGGKNSRGRDANLNMTVNDRCCPVLASPRPPDPDTRRSGVDHAAAPRAARELLGAVGADVDPFEPTTFPNDGGYDQLLVVGAIPSPSLRGVQKLGAMTVTSALRGLVRDDVRTRQEFLALTKRSSHDQ